MIMQEDIKKRSGDPGDPPGRNLKISAKKERINAERKNDKERTKLHCVAMLAVKRKRGEKNATKRKHKDATQATKHTQHKHTQHTTTNNDKHTHTQTQKTKSKHAKQRTKPNKHNEHTTERDATSRSSKPSARFDQNGAPVKQTG